MATTTTITKLLFRRGNDADRKQTILASGEPGWTLDTKRLWIGDGITPGGVPSLSARPEHLMYVDVLPNPATGVRWTDEEEQRGIGPESLDINIPGLAHTLAGEPITDEALRWFHPVNRDIETSHDMTFTSSTAGIKHTGTGTFRIGKDNNSEDTGNIINIGDAIYVYADGTIKLKGVEDAALIFDSASAVFNNQTATHYEDKSHDFNVVYDDNDEKQDEGSGATAESTGIYVAHDNYLSAGHMAVGSLAEPFGWNTWELQPPVYNNDWEGDDVSGYPANPTGRGTTSDTYTKNWTNSADGMYVGNKSGSGDYTSKPLIFHSTRPSAGTTDNGNWAGDAHFVFESGLIVYDSGDTSTGAYNAYKINQSVDVRAKPEFAGLTITPGGDPIPVNSGGTGVNNFIAGGVIASHPTDATGDLRSLRLDTGELLTGSSTGVKVTTFATNDNVNGISIASNDTTGQITFTNEFSPAVLQSKQELRERWFARFQTWNTDISEVTAQGRANSDPGETINLRGDKNTTTGNYGGTIRTIGAGGAVDQKSVTIEHAKLGEKIYNNLGEPGGAGITLASNYGNVYGQSIYAGATSDDIGIEYYQDLVPTDQVDTNNNAPEQFQDTGVTFAGVVIDAGGHILGTRSKDFDDRYPLFRNMGPDGNTNSPADLTTEQHTPGLNTRAESILGVTHDTPGYGELTRVISSIGFNHYGTVSEYGHVNLHDTFYDKAQTGKIAQSLYDDIVALEDLVDNLNYFDSHVDSNSGPSTIETTWLRKSQIRFESGNSVTTDGNRIYADTDEWLFHAASDQNIQINTKRGKYTEWHNEDNNGDTTREMLRVGSDTNGNTLIEFKQNTTTKLSFSGQSDTLSVTCNNINMSSGDMLFKDTSSNAASITLKDSTDDTRVSITTSSIRYSDTSGSQLVSVDTDGITLTNTDNAHPIRIHGTSEYAEHVWSGTTDNVTNVNEVHHIGLLRYNNTTTDSSTAQTPNTDSGLKFYPALDKLVTGTVEADLFVGEIDGGASKVKTQSRSNNADHYLTFVDSNNTQATEEFVYTDASVKYNPNTNRLSVPSLLLDSNNNGALVGVNSGEMVVELQETDGSFTRTVSIGDDYVRCKGDIVAFHSFSDERLKTNINNLDSDESLNQVLQLQGVTFDWRDEAGAAKGEQLGLIAQQVEAVTPQVVNENKRVDDDETYKRVDYDKLVPLLIESVKALTARVKQLESQLDQ